MSQRAGIVLGLLWACSLAVVAGWMVGGLTWHCHPACAGVMRPTSQLRLRPAFKTSIGSSGLAHTLPLLGANHNEWGAPAAVAFNSLLEHI